MKIVAFKKEVHYPTMIKLWQECGWEPCPLEALPRIGIVAETESGEFLAYVGMYLEIGKIGFIDWALVNKEKKVSGSKALAFLVCALFRLAKKCDCHFVYSATKVEAWKEILLKAGMKTAETGADTFVKALNNENTDFIGD